MLWKDREQSENVEDRRGLSGGKVAVGGGVGVLLVAAAVWLLGGNPAEVLNSLQTSGVPNAPADARVIEAEAPLKQLAAVVLKDTEDIWQDLFRQSGRAYRNPKLVLFSGSVESACGFSSAATGPFYCPGDDRLYLDLSFLDALQKKLGAQGDFATAYIIAHEVGHHVQNQLGISGQLQSSKSRLSEKEYKQKEVQLELQADFLAGIWAYYAQKTKHILEEGDLDEAVNAASAVGDDRLQMKSQGYVVPDAFTHGTSEQRKSAFLKGFRTGDLRQGGIDLVRSVP